MKHITVGLFVPHKGCPHQCSFCNQKSISGQTKNLTASDVHEAIATALENPNLKNAEMLRTSKMLQDKIEVLKEYYQSGLWLQDYECDERGELPENLKRGILSQDALYDFFSENKVG